LFFLGETIEIRATFGHDSLLVVLDLNFSNCKNSVKGCNSPASKLRESSMLEKKVSILMKEMSSLVALTNETSLPCCGMSC
jgi:hypothetical protein